MLKTSFKVVVPLLKAGERYESLSRSGAHLSSGHGKTAGEVEQVLHHLLAELHEGGDLDGLSLSGGGLTLDIDQRLH